MKTLGGGSIDLLLVDLPYGVTARNSWDAFIPFVSLWSAYERIEKENEAMVFTVTQPFA